MLEELKRRRKAHIPTILGPFGEIAFQGGENESTVSRILCDH